MELQSISNRYFTLDEVLYDIPETATAELTDIEETYQRFIEELNEELKTTDRIWLEFQAGQCEQFGHAAKSLLYRIVKSSVGHPENSKAAANAITILKVMGASLSALDFKGVHINGADLSNAILDDADMSESNVSYANLTNASLNRLNLQDADLTQTNIGVAGLIQSDSEIQAFVAISKNNYLIKDEKRLYILDQETEKIKSFKDWTEKTNIFQLTTLNDRYCIVSTNQAVFIYSTDQLEEKFKIDISILKDSSKTRLHCYVSNNKNILAILNSSNTISTETYEQYTSNEETKIEIWEIVWQNEAISKLVKIKEWKEPYYIENAFFTPNDDMFIIVQNSNMKQNIHFWAMRTMSQVANVRMDMEYKSIFFTNDGTSFLLVQDGLKGDAKNDIIYKYEFKKLCNNWTFNSDLKEEVFREEYRLNFVGLIPKTNIAVYIKDTIDSYPAICFRDIEKNMVLSCYEVLGLYLEDIHISKDGQNILQIYKKQGRIYIQDIQEQIRQNVQPSLESLNTLAFSSDSKLITALSSSESSSVYSIQKYDAWTGRIISYLKNIDKPYYQNSSRRSLGILSGLDTYSLSENSEMIIQKMKRYNKKIPAHSLLESVRLIDKSISKSRDDFFNLISAKAMNASYNGEFIAAIENNKLQLWLRPHRTPIFESELKDIKLACDQIYKIVFSRKFTLESGYIALADDNYICLIEFHQNAIKRLLKHSVFGENHEKEKIRVLKFLKDDQVISIISNKSIMLWEYGNNIETRWNIDCYKFSKNEDLNTEHAINDIPYTFDISLDGKFLISILESDEEGDEKKLYFGENYHVVRLWDLATKELLAKKEVIPELASVRFSPDGKLITSWLWGGNCMYTWQRVHNTFRLLWRSSSTIEAHNLNIRGVKELSKHTKELLMYEGAKE